MESVNKRVAGILFQHNFKALSPSGKGKSLLERERHHDAMDFRGSRDHATCLPNHVAKT